MRLFKKNGIPNCFYFDDENEAIEKIYLFLHSSVAKNKH